MQRLTWRGVWLKSICSRFVLSDSCWSHEENSMTRSLLRWSTLCLIFGLMCVCSILTVHAQVKPGRDPNQPIDEEYTKKIREYTTETFFNSPLTDYLPASAKVPTPKAVLGDVAGAPGKLPYAAEVYSYMRMLEKASPRVKVFS